MWPLLVVVTDVLVQGASEAVLSEGQHPVGHFGCQGTNELRGVCVGLWDEGRDFHDGDGGVGEDGVKGCGELPGTVTDQEPELGCTIRRGRRAGCGLCWVVQGPSGWRLCPGCGRDGC